MRRALLIVLVLAGCRGGGDSGRAIALWHTFDRGEIPVLEAALAGQRVVTREVPFERAQNVLQAAFERGGDECPDVARVDAAWIPGFANAGLLLPAPSEVAALPVHDAARMLAEHDGTRYGIAQTWGCQALVGLDAAPKSADALEAALADHEFQVRTDGFWALPWLLAEGVTLFDATTGAVNIDSPAAVRALARLARLAQAKHPGQSLVRLEGPWAANAVDPRVVPFPPGPDGRPSSPVVGQIWVVGRCTKHADDAWRLVQRLTDGSNAARFAAKTSALPAREGVAVPPVVAQFIAACPARTLPRHPMSAALFEDLTPAIAAVVRGDATPEEALADVARGWQVRWAHLAEAHP